MAEEMTYTVRVTREGKQWLAEVEDLPGAHTFAGNLTKLETATREVIALVEDLPAQAENTINLVWDFSEIAPIAVEAAHLATQRRENEQIHETIAARTRELVSDFLAQGWSVRDIAGVLALSPGRISQISTTEAARLASQ